MKEKVFDSQLFDRTSQSNWLGEFNLKAALEQLRAEGLPTSLDFINEICATPQSFTDWVIAQQRKRLSGDYMLTSERDAIIQGFRDMYDRLSPKIEALRGSIGSSLVLKAKGDTVVNDTKALEAKQKANATIEINTELASEWYSKYRAVIDAHKSLMAFEEKKGFVSMDLRFNEMVASFNWAYQREREISEDLFIEIMKYRLK